jgi:hypothetical protein
MACFEAKKWRRGGDSNPRYGFPYAGLANLCFQPLSHLSDGAWYQCGTLNCKGGNLVGHVAAVNGISAKKSNISVN